MTIKSALEERGIDAWGSGYFGAKRGNRKHKGIDYACRPGSKICSPVDGQITKLGYPYSSDLSFRYVEITDKNGARHRLFYVLPDVGVGDIIFEGDVCGTAQDVAGKYTTPDRVMKNHIHYEILVDGEPVDPDKYQLNDWSKDNEYF